MSYKMVAEEVWRGDGAKRGLRVDYEDAMNGDDRIYTGTPHNESITFPDFIYDQQNMTIDNPAVTDWMSNMNTHRKLLWKEYDKQLKAHFAKLTEKRNRNYNMERAKNSKNSDRSTIPNRTLPVLR